MAVPAGGAPALILSGDALAFLSGWWPTCHCVDGCVCQVSCRLWNRPLHYSTVG